MARDVITVLNADHEDIEGMFAEVEFSLGAFGTPAIEHRLRATVDRLLAELVRLWAAEQQYLSPVLRDCLPHGRELADELSVEQAETARTMWALEGLSMHDPSLPVLLLTLIGQTRTHVRRERDVLFPALRATLSRQQQEAVGARIQAERTVTPPHAQPRTAE